MIERYPGDPPESTIWPKTSTLARSMQSRAALLESHARCARLATSASIAAEYIGA
jgi:hypothetical protein